MIRRPPRSTPSNSSAASDVYKRQGLELPLVREKFGDKLIVVVPGVRPVDNVKDDQKRKIDIFQAFKKGADHVVMGRPIKNAIDPLQTVERFQQDIVSALA